MTYFVGFLERFSENSQNVFVCVSTNTHLSSRDKNNHLIMKG